MVTMICFDFVIVYFSTPQKKYIYMTPPLYGGESKIKKMFNRVLYFGLYTKSIFLN